MKNFIIALLVVFGVSLVAGPAFAGKEKTEMNWEKGTFTVYLSTGDVKNLEPYAHIWNYNSTDKTRKTYKQSFAANVVDFKVIDEGKTLVVTVLIPDLTSEKIVRIWANNGKESMYYNLNNFYAFPALNETTGVLHYDFEARIVPKTKTVEKNLRGSEMDKFAFSN